MAEFHGAHLALPEGDFLPTSLRCEPGMHGLWSVWL